MTDSQESQGDDKPSLFFLSDYEGFSKQDLEDRREALLRESDEMFQSLGEIGTEVRTISKLLEELK